MELLLLGPSGVSVSLQRLCGPQAQHHGWHTPHAPSHWTPHPKQGWQAPQTRFLLLFLSLFLPCKSFLPPTPPLRQLSQSRLSAWSRAE